MCSSCGGNRRARRTQSLQQIISGVASVPTAIAVYIEYTGEIRIAVRGPRTTKLYGEFFPGETFAVFPEDAEHLLRQSFFVAGKAPANVQKVNTRNRPATKLAVRN